MAIDPKQVQALFLEVIQGDMAERSAILDRVCGEDTALRRLIEVLLRAHDDSGELPPAAGIGTTASKRSPAQTFVAPRSLSGREEIPQAWLGE